MIKITTTIKQENGEVAVVVTGEGGKDADKPTDNETITANIVTGAINAVMQSIKEVSKEFEAGMMAQGANSKPC